MGTSERPPADAALPKTVSTARRVAQRATDLLAISLVVMCGLTAGRQVMDWWRTDSSPRPLAGDLADPQFQWSERPLDIQVGAQGQGLQRIPFTGTRDAAEQQLIQLARSALQEFTAMPSPVTDAEAGWLAVLAKTSPLESHPEWGTIYRVPGFLPSVAATKSLSAQSGEPTPRLVTWGIATPRGPDAWTLMMFPQTAAARTETSEDLYLPDGAEILLAWRDVTGHRVISFRGQGECRQWLAEFDRQFAGQTTVAAIENERPLVGRWRTREGWIDVQLMQNGAEITGLLWMTAAVKRHNAAERN